MMLERMTLKDSEHAAYEARKAAALEAETDRSWLATTAYLSVSVKCAKCGIYLPISGQIANTLLVDAAHPCDTINKLHERIDQDEREEKLDSDLRTAGGVVSDGHTSKPTNEVPAPGVFRHEGPSPDHFS